MPYTNCKVHMEFTDTTAVADGSVSTENNFIYGKTDLFKVKQDYPTYAYMDLNQFVLDGTQRILTEGVQLPFVSNQISGSGCEFGIIPTVWVEFATKHTSAGLTLYFGQDYPSEIKLTWYDLVGVKITDASFYPNEKIYFCHKQVENYGKVKIEFIRSRLPEQRVELYYIKYGSEIWWNEENIQKANIHEEVDCTGATIPINTADISIVDSENSFDLHNQEGTWKSIQKKQEVQIWEELDNKEINAGTMFIDTWSSKGNVVSFSLIDRLGVMDKTKFYKGRIYEDEAAGDIIDEIMVSAGVEDYDVAEEIRAMKLTGHLGICSHKEALQQVAFACGAVVDCGRSARVKVFLPDRFADTVVGPERKFETLTRLDTYVSGVSITYNTFKLADKENEIYKDTLIKGDNRIEFSEPYQPESLAASSGSIVEANTNYMVVRMAADALCIVTGTKYESTEVTYSISKAQIDAGEEENTLTFSGCTLMNAERVRTIAEKLLDYYQLRQIVQVEYILQDEKTGDWVNLRDTEGRMVVSGITSQDIDLTGGFIATAICRGYSKVVTANVYVGEIYSGERGMI